MKKTISLLLALVLSLSLCACGGKNDTPVTTEALIESAAPTEKVPISQDISSNTDTESAADTEENTAELVDGMRPEFKEAMDAYEAFYNEYFEFMEEYKKNPTDMTLLLKYTEMLSKIDEMNKAFEAWDEEELNDAELKYYLDVNNRVMKLLVDVAG